MSSTSDPRQSSSVPGLPDRSITFHEADKLEENDKIEMASLTICRRHPKLTVLSQQLRLRIDGTDYYFEWDPLDSWQRNDRY